MLQNADFLIAEASSRCDDRLRSTRILGSIGVVC